MIRELVIKAMGRAMKFCALVGIVFVAAQTSSCYKQEEPRPRPEMTLTSDGIGRIRLCSDLALVDSVYGEAVRNEEFTDFGEEGVSWPAKRVAIGDGHLVFEAGEIDRRRIRRIAVTSSSISSTDGYRAGMLIDSLARTGTALRVGVEEGILVIGIGEGRLTVTVDAAAQNAFAQLPDLRELTSKLIPPAARIAELIMVGGECDSQPTP